MDLNLNIKKVLVLTGKVHADEIFVVVDEPEPIWPYDGRLTLEFKAAQGTGLNYCIKTLGISEDLIETIKI